MTLRKLFFAMYALSISLYCVLIFGGGKWWFAGFLALSIKQIYGVIDSGINDPMNRREVMCK